MRATTTVLVRCALFVLFSLVPAFSTYAHPGSGIVIDGNGQIFFCQTGVCLWKLDADGQIARLDAPGYHWLALDKEGGFLGQRWPRYREHMRRGVISYGDAEIKAIGKNPTLLGASSFPIAVGNDGNLYYPEAGLDERVHVKKLAPNGKPAEFAVLPLVTEIAPDFRPWKALWIHGLAVGPDGDLFYTEKEAVRKIDIGGNVSLVAENFKVPGWTPSENHRGGPILRGLDVSDKGTVYVAAMASQAVLRISADGKTSVALRSEESWTPTGIAIQGDDVYVLEYWFAEPEEPQSWLPRVRKLSSDGTIALLATVTEVPKSG